MHQLLIEVQRKLEKLIIELLRESIFYVSE